MNISEVMTRDVQVGSPDDVLQKAAQLMEQNDFGILPIGENDRLVGMLSDRDITIRAVARGLAPDQCKVREVMSRSLSMPTNRSFSPIGNMPKSFCSISWAAFCNTSSGEATWTSRVITSLMFMAISSVFPACGTGFVNYRGIPAALLSACI